MLTYADARRRLATARNQSAGKPVANNTRLYPAGHDGRSVAVCLHGTDVVVLRPNGTAVLNSGGYRTMTTADRIRRYAPARTSWGLSVHSHQKSGAWALQTREGEPVAFFDGVRVNANGHVLRADERYARRLFAKQCDDFRAHRRERARVRRAINREKDLVVATMPDYLATVRACGGTMADARAALLWSHGALVNPEARQIAGRAIDSEPARLRAARDLAVLLADAVDDDALLATWDNLPYHVRARGRVATDSTTRLGRLLIERTTRQEAERRRRMAAADAASMETIGGYVAAIKALPSADNRIMGTMLSRVDYAPGFVAAFDWRDDHRCGGGLHFTRRPDWSKQYCRDARAFALCGTFGGVVKIDDHKWKAPYAVVFRDLTAAEVADINAERVTARDLLAAELGLAA